MNDIDTEIGTGKKRRRKERWREYCQREEKRQIGEEKDEDDKEVEEKDVDEE